MKYIDVIKFVFSSNERKNLAVDITTCVSISALMLCIYLRRVDVNELGFAIENALKSEEKYE